MARDDYMDAKYLDELIECIEGLLVYGVEVGGKKPDDNWGVTVSSLKLRALLDYCAILRPLMDAVELGEVDQYRKGLEDGRREGRESQLAEVVRMLDDGFFDDWNYEEVAEYLRGLKSTALGEVDQYKKGLEDGRKEGRRLGVDQCLEGTARMLESGGADVLTATELAVHLRSLKGGKLTMGVESD